MPPPRAQKRTPRKLAELGRAPASKKTFAPTGWMVMQQSASGERFLRSILCHQKAYLQAKDEMGIPALMRGQAAGVVYLQTIKLTRDIHRRPTAALEVDPRPQRLRSSSYHFAPGTIMLLASGSTSQLTFDHLPYSRRGRSRSSAAS